MDDETNMARLSYKGDKGSCQDPVQDLVLYQDFTSKKAL